MKVIAVIGHHNSGKTTLIERLSLELAKRGLRVGYIKHDPKGHGVTDKEGSDTDRLFRVLDRVALVSPGKVTLWIKREDNPLEVASYFFKGFDVVILEGYKSLKGIPKIAVGEVDAEDIILKIEGLKDISHVIELLESMEDNLWV